MVVNAQTRLPIEMEVISYTLYRHTIVVNVGLMNHYDQCTKGVSNGCQQGGSLIPIGFLKENREGSR